MIVPSHLRAILSEVSTKSGDLLERWSIYISEWQGPSESRSTGISPICGSI
jgi:hypothetical protein